MCGEEKEEAEKSPLYDYKRAYFKIVQALIDDHRTAFKIFFKFLSNFSFFFVWKILDFEMKIFEQKIQNFECNIDLDI